MTYHHKNIGTCSSGVTVAVEDGIITEICFQEGCEGNLKGLAVMCVGQPAGQVIEQLRGITCGVKETSCPDQLALALVHLQKMCKSSGREGLSN